MTFESLITKVQLWGRDKGIVGKSNAYVQMAKMREEMLELRQEVMKGDMRGIKDELGDVLVTCVIQAECHGLELAECLEHAYDKITKRKGTLVNGMFVKEMLL